MMPLLSMFAICKISLCTCRRVERFTLGVERRDSGQTGHDVAACNRPRAELELVRDQKG